MHEENIEVRRLINELQGNLLETQSVVERNDLELKNILEINDGSFKHQVESNMKQLRQELANAAWAFANADQNNA